MPPSRRRQPGGNWKHGTYETVHIISSRKTTEYKDTPMPASYPDFPSKDEMLEYLQDYADVHRLREHMTFNTEVVAVQPCRGDVTPGPVPTNGQAVALAAGKGRKRGTSPGRGMRLANGHTASAMPSAVNGMPASASDAVPAEELDGDASYGRNGWIVTVRDCGEGGIGIDNGSGSGSTNGNGTSAKTKVQTLHYDAVIVANGHHWDCRKMGPYPGQADFEGEVIHSKQYKHPRQLVGKRVLVIGGGNSACDIAVEAGRFAAESHVSHRRGYWFLPRLLLGKPLIELVPAWMPIWLQRLVLRVTLRIVTGRYESYGLQHPDHKLWERHPTINSELLECVRKGIVKPHGDIARFTGGKGVEFTDGSRADFDLICHATGYHVSLPLLDGLVQWTARREVKNDGEASRNFPDLLEGLISPRHFNLMVMGLGQPRYGAGPLITAGAEGVAKMLLAQTQMAHPLGRTLRALGVRRLTNYLLDPHRTFTLAVAITRLARHLPTLERWLVGRPLHVDGDTAAAAVAASPDADADAGDGDSEDDSDGEE